MPVDVARAQQVAQERLLQRLGGIDLRSGGLARLATCDSHQHVALNSPASQRQEVRFDGTPARHGAEEAAAHASRAVLGRHVELADAALRERDEVVAALEAERRHHTTAAASSSAATAALQDRVQLLEAERARLETELLALGRTRDALAERQAAAEEALREADSLRVELAAAQERCAAAEEALREADGRAAASAAAMEAMQQASNAAMEAMQQDLGHLREELAKTRSDSAAERAEATHAAAAMHAQVELLTREKDAAVSSSQLATQQAQQALELCEAHAAEAHSAAQTEQLCAQLQAALSRCKRSKHLTQGALAWHALRSSRQRISEAPMLVLGSPAGAPSGLQAPGRLLFYLFSFWRQLAQRSGRMAGPARGLPLRARPPRPPSPASRARMLLASLQATNEAGPLASEDRLLASLKAEVEQLVALQRNDSGGWYDTS
jgi:hypothetical protein